MQPNLAALKPPGGENRGETATHPYEEQGYPEICEPVQRIKRNGPSPADDHDSLQLTGTARKDSPPSLALVGESILDDQPAMTCPQSLGQS